MADYYKTIAGTLVVVILYLILQRQGKELATLLSIAACCLILTVATGYLRPIMRFFEQLQQTGNIDTSLYEILLKAVCVGLTGEIILLICSDSGNIALGKSVQLLTVCVMIWTCLPMLTELMTLIETILGSI